jgi:hypothetical protein
MTIAVSASPVPILQFFGNNGLPLVGGSLVCQVGGVAYPVYQDAAGSIPLPFTGVNGGVPLNSRGEISNAAGASCQLFLAEDVVYTFTLYDANGNLLNQATSVEALVPTASSIGTALASAYTAALAAEASVGAVITNEAFLPLNILRYGGDNTGTIPDNSTAFTTLINVMLALGGASVELPSGTYNLTNSVTFTTVPSGAGASAAAKGLNFYGYGVLIDFSPPAAGIAFDATNLATITPYNYLPSISWYGINIKVNVTATGGWRQSDICDARYYDCFVIGPSNGTAGPCAGFTVRNLTQFSENNHFIGCGVVTVQSGISFVFTSGAAVSMARTTVRDFFFAGVQPVASVGGYVFDIGGGCAPFNSRFTHICGNFGPPAIACFGIGTSTGSSATMTGTVIDGLDYEFDGVAAPTYQCVIRLRDWPQASGAARPIVYNVGSLASDNGAIPVWAGGNSATAQTVIPGPELTEIQGFGLYAPINSAYGQSTAFEQSYNAQAVRNSATTQSLLSNTGQGSLITLTGFTTTVSGRLLMQRCGNLVNVTVFDALTGTSNATSMTFTITQPEFMPSGTRNVPTYVEDNGIAVVPALAEFAALSTYASGTFTTTVPAGSISATLGAAWTNTTGIYLMNFSAETLPRPVTLTNGLTTCTWTEPLLNTSNTGYTVSGCVVTFAIATAFNTYSATGFTATGTKGLTTGTSFTYSL